ncbi:unnamed protein product, partial [Brassica rapa subsp. trilocularis]
LSIIIKKRVSILLGCYLRKYSHHSATSVQSITKLGVSLNQTLFLDFSRAQPQNEIQPRCFFSRCSDVGCPNFLPDLANENENSNRGSLDRVLVVLARNSRIITDTDIDPIAWFLQLHVCFFSEVAT